MKQQLRSWDGQTNAMATKILMTSFSFYSVLCRKGSRKHTRESSRRYRSISPHNRRAYSPDRVNSHKKHRGHDRSRYDSPRRSGRHSVVQSRDRYHDARRKDKEYHKQDRSRAEDDSTRTREKRKVESGTADAEGDHSLSAKNEKSQESQDGVQLHEDVDVLEEMRKRALTALLEQKKSTDTTPAVGIQHLDLENESEELNDSGTPKTGMRNGWDTIGADGPTADDTEDQGCKSPTADADRELERKKDQKDNRRYRKRIKSEDASPIAERRSKQGTVKSVF